MTKSHPLVSIFYTSTPLTTFTFTQAKHGFPLLFPFFILLLLLLFAAVCFYSLRRERTTSRYWALKSSIIFSFLHSWKSRGCS
jgi:hypothetical protein